MNHDIMINLTTSLLRLLALISAVTGASIEKRIVFSPPVLYPNKNTVWRAGDWHNVTWNMTGAPPPDMLTSGGLMLLTKDRMGPFFGPYLASNFDMYENRTVVQVPFVEPGNDYAIVLFGDSGNFGQNFTIENDTPFTTPLIPASYFTGSATTITASSIIDAGTISATALSSITPGSETTTVTPVSGGGGETAPGTATLPSASSLSTTSSTTLSSGGTVSTSGSSTSSPASTSNTSSALILRPIPTRIFAFLVTLLLTTGVGAGLVL